MRKTVTSLVGACGMVAVASAVLPGNAFAGEMFVNGTDGGANRATYVAEPGETNVVSMSISDGTVVVRDEAARVTSTDDACQQTSPHEARCEAGNVTLILRDGADRAEVTGGFATVDGGDGDDALIGGEGDSVLNGGSGDDQIFGGAGRDDLYGGAGTDLLSGEAGPDSLQGDETYYDFPGGPESIATDRLEGGPGDDSASYGDRTRAVHVDLTRGEGGEPGESDQLDSVESTFGSSGDDLLIGTAGPNTLQGGDGDDVIRSGSGDDYLEGGSGRDRLDAGPGDDDLRATEFELVGDVLACGLGRDDVFLPSGRDLLGRCEWASGGFDDEEIGRVSIRPVRRRSGGVLGFRVRCPDLYVSEECRGRVTLHSGRGRFASLGPPRRFGMTSGGSRLVTFDLSRAATQALRRPRALLQVRLRTPRSQGCTFCRMAWRTRVRPRL